MIWHCHSMIEVLRFQEIHIRELAGEAVAS